MKDETLILEAEPEAGRAKARTTYPESEPAKAGTTIPKGKPVKRAMTDDERVVVPLLWSQVRYSVGSWDKRFAREIQYVMNEGMITDGQSGQVWRIFKRYRRQIVCSTPEEKERLLAWAEAQISAKEPSISETDDCQGARRVSESESI